MNFVIYFVRPNMTPITGGELRKHFRGRKNMTLEQDGLLLRITYFNPLSRATCIFLYNSAGLGEAAAHDQDLCRRAQLSCVMDYIRPTHFAYEAVQEMATVVHELSLEVLCPESRRSPGQPAMFSPEEVLGDWKAAGARAMAGQSPPPPYVQPKFSGMLWKYMLVRDLIAQKAGPEVQAPEVEVWRDGVGSNALTAIRWDYGCPTVLPPCQGVIINRLKRKGIFGIGRKEEAGLARYSDVLEAMRPFLRSLALERPSYSAPVLPLNPPKAAQKALLSIPLKPLPKGASVVPVEGFVDVRPA